LRSGRSGLKLDHERPRRPHQLPHARTDAARAARRASGACAPAREPGRADRQRLRRRFRARPGRRARAGGAEGPGRSDHLPDESRLRGWCEPGAASRAFRVESPAFRVPAQLRCAACAGLDRAPRARPRGAAAGGHRGLVHPRACRRYARHGVPLPERGEQLRGVARPRGRHAPARSLGRLEAGSERDHARRLARRRLDVDPPRGVRRDRRLRRELLLLFRRDRLLPARRARGLHDVVRPGESRAPGGRTSRSRAPPSGGTAVDGSITRTTASSICGPRISPGCWASSSARPGAG